MKYIDIHCHLGFPDYDADREELISKMKKNEITAISVGVDFETSKKELKLANKYENIFACVGQHPENAKDGFDERISELAKESKVVAIGECGLDYFGHRSLGESGLSEDYKNKQKKLFESQIDLALEVDKPLMLHIRPSDKISYDAYFDSLEMLESYNKIHGTKLRGNVHFFAGDVLVAKKFLDLGFTMSFTGVITFTHDYDEVIKYIPQNSIMSETDAPFVAPVPYRGKRNEPAYVIEVVKKMAEIKGESVEILNNSIINNAKRTFNL
jgi:TatD DNase family protein